MNPCPFCGESHSVVEFVGIGDYDTSVYAGKCMNCGARGPEVSIGSTAMHASPKRAMSKALIKWNERKP